MLPSFQNTSQIDWEVSETFLHYGNTLLGPILKLTGTEQGGVSRLEQFQLVGNSELWITSNYELGLKVYGVIVSSIGPTHELALISPTLYGLF